MKKCIAVLLIILLSFLCACGSSEGTPEPSPTESAETNSSTDKEENTQQDTVSESTEPVLTDSIDISLHSDDTQYVMKMGDLYTVYYLDNGTVVGMSTYCCYDTKQIAEDVARQSTPDVDPSVSECILCGNAVLIKYKEQSYTGLTSDMLDSVFYDLKVN